MVVYFDEASFNNWMRPNRTWSGVDRPVKMIIQQNRCQGITVFGAIGLNLQKPVFMQGQSTNWEEVMKFL